MKTKSNRVAYREKRLKYLTNENFTIDPISILLLVIFYIVFSYLSSRTIFEGEELLNFFSILFIVMATGGAVGGMMFSIAEASFRANGFKIEIFDFRTKLTIPYAAAMGIAFFVTLILQKIASATLSLTSLEQYLFYTFAAIAEEFFYRFFIATGVYLLSMKLFETANVKNKYASEAFTLITATIISVVITSLYFFASHLTRYGDQPTVLVLMFALSSIWTALYVFTKSLLPPLIVHLIMNAIVNWTLLIVV